MLDRQKKCPGFRQDLNPRYPDHESGVLATRPRSWKSAGNYLALFMLLLLTITDLKNKK